MLFLYHIVSELKSILKQLAEGVELKERERGKLHEVFEPSFDAKKCYNLKFLEQKLDYIHHNPVSGKWKLADSFIDYIHSSAAFYETGGQCKVKLTHYLDAGVSPSPALTHRPRKR